MLQPVDWLPRDHCHAIDQRYDAVCRSDVIGGEAGKISLDQGALAADDRPANHQARNGGMRLNVCLRRGNKAQPEEIVDHALAEHLVRRRGTLEQLAEVVVGE